MKAAACTILGPLLCTAAVYCVNGKVHRTYKEAVVSVFGPRGGTWIAVVQYPNLVLTGNHWRHSSWLGPCMCVCQGCDVRLHLGPACWLVHVQLSALTYLMLLPLCHLTIAALSYNIVGGQTIKWVGCLALGGVARMPEPGHLHCCLCRSCCRPRSCSRHVPCWPCCRTLVRNQCNATGATDCFDSYWVFALA